MSFSRNDYLLALFALIVWAGNLVAIKMAVLEVQPLTAATLRFAGVGFVFLPFLRKIDKSSLWIIFQISFFMNVLHIGTLFIALKMLDAASVSILLQTQVVFATIFGWLFFKEQIRWRTWTGITIASAGVLLMLGSPDLSSHPKGVAIMLFSTIMLVLGYVRMKHLKSVHAASYVCLLALFSIPFSFIASLVFEQGSWAALPSADWHMLGPVLAFQATIVSFTHIIWQRLMHRGDVGKVAALTMTVPFFTAILSYFLLDERVTMMMIAGGLITMLGVGIITMRRIQKGIAKEEQCVPQ